MAGVNGSRTGEDYWTEIVQASTAPIMRRKREILKGGQETESRTELNV